MHQFADLAVYDSERKATPLPELWRDQPTLLFFLRSPGCAICRQKLFELKRNSTLFDQHNIKIVAISLVNPMLLGGLIQQYQLPFEMYSDLNGEVYQAFGFSQTKENLLANPEILRRVDVAAKEGILMSDEMGVSLAQLGGVVLFEQGADEPLFVHVADPVYSYPEWQELIERFPDHAEAPI